MESTKEIINKDVIMLIEDYVKKAEGSEKQGQWPREAGRPYRESGGSFGHDFYFYISVMTLPSVLEGVNLAVDGKEALARLMSAQG